MTGVPSVRLGLLPQPASGAVKPSARAARVRAEQRLPRVQTTVIIYPLRSDGRGRSRHRRLEAQTGNPFPTITSDLVARSGKRASLPVSRRSQLIVSCAAPVVLPLRSIAVGYDWRCRVPDASREFQARTAT